MKQPTVDQVKAMAKEAAFYQNEDGEMRRMMMCDDEFFVCEDEDEMRFCNIEYSDVTFSGFTAFYKLEKMPLPE